MLYFFILAHQADFDVKWCRGTTGEMIFKPWVERIEENGAKVLVERRVLVRIYWFYCLYTILRKLTQERGTTLRPELATSPSPLAGSTARDIELASVRMVRCRWTHRKGLWTKAWRQKKDTRHKHTTNQRGLLIMTCFEKPRCLQVSDFGSIEVVNTLP